MKKYADKKRRELEFSIAYKLCLPAASKIHPLFHVSQLKKVQELPNQFEAQEEHMIEPEHVQGYRPINRNNQMISQVLVQWKGLSADETTWIDKADFQGWFPYFSLEDKADLKEEGNDKEGQGKNITRSFKFYSTRPKGQGKEKGILKWQKGMTVAEFKESRHVAWRH